MDMLPEKSSLGMEANTAAGLSALAAVLGFGIVPLILFLVEKDSKFVKFHSVQALALTVVAVVLSIAAGLLSVIIIGFFIYPLVLVVWVFMIIQTINAFGGKYYKVPLIGDFCAKQAGLE